MIKEEKTVLAKVKIGQLIAPVLNNGQHLGDAVFRFNHVVCNP